MTQRSQYHLACHAHPNALDSTGALKFGAPLQSFWATSSRRTTNVFLSALSNALPFLKSWGAFLLSTVMWMQLAVLSGYPLRAVRASMKAVGHRLLAKTAWDMPSTLRWVLGPVHSTATATVTRRHHPGPHGMALAIRTLAGHVLRILAPAQLWGLFRFLCRLVI